MTEPRRKLKETDLDAYIQNFLAARQPELARKYSALIQDRLRHGPKAIAWQSLAGLRSLRDKQFTKIPELTTALTSAKVSYQGNEELTRLVARFFQLIHRHHRLFVLGLASVDIFTRNSKCLLVRGE